MKGSLIYYTFELVGRYRLQEWIKERLRVEIAKKNKNFPSTVGMERGEWMLKELCQ